MGQARFLLYTGFTFFLLCRSADPNFHSAKLWITQPVMFIRQKLLKHWYAGNVTDIVFFIMCKVYFLLVLSKRWIRMEY